MEILRGFVAWVEDRLSTTTTMHMAAAYSPLRRPRSHPLFLGLWFPLMATIVAMLFDFHRR